MKKLLAIFTVILLSTSAMADQRSVSSATVTDHYKNVIKQTPYNVEVCKQVQTGSNYTNSATNELFGAILGGAIGNQFGNGDGKDAMTIFGALLGASMANDQQNAQGPIRNTTVCNVETRYQETVTKVYSHSTITFVSNGRRYNVDFKK